MEDYLLALGLVFVFVLIEKITALIHKYLDRKAIKHREKFVQLKDWPFGVTIAKGDEYTMFDGTKWINWRN